MRYRLSVAGILTVAALGCGADVPTAPDVPLPGRTEFSVSVAQEPVIALANFDVVPGAPIEWWDAQVDVTVTAPSDVGGTLRRLELTLRDRLSGEILDSFGHESPFWQGSAGKGWGPNPLANPGGSIREVIDLYDRLHGFHGAPAALEIRAEIYDQRGASRVALTQVGVEPLMPPLQVAPVRVSVRQNDPSTGCPFDPEHGYGFAIEFDWKPVDSVQRISSYTVAVFDGQHQPITYPTFTGAVRPPLRYVRCDYHVIEDRRLGARWAVWANLESEPSDGLPAWAYFDFESCREAGTPACR